MQTTHPLRCPVCGDELFENQMRPSSRFRTLKCERGHSFDPAKSGYINFLTGRGTKHRSDTAEMIEARQRFLEAGHYMPLVAQMKRALGELTPMPFGPVVDLGVGTGYYLSALADLITPDIAVSSASGTAVSSAPASGLLAPAPATGMDLSVAALKQYRKNRPQDRAVAWDLWRPLPFADHSVGLVLNIFAPHNFPEFARILRTDGYALLVTPQAQHLHQLREPGLALEVQLDKDIQLQASIAQAGLHQVLEAPVSFDMHLSAPALADLSRMGPAAFHTAPEQTQQRVQTFLDGHSHASVSASFTVRVLAHG